MSTKSREIFWMSYSDLLTSLFFIMLALYAATFYLLTQQQQGLRAKAEELDRIRDLQSSIESLKNTGHFVYQPDYKRFEISYPVSFERGSAVIAPQYRAKLQEVGRSIDSLIDQQVLDDRVRYLIVIEGMASKDDYARNYELSYERALSLYRLWTGAGGIRFDTSKVEIQLAGSGIGGLGRLTPERRNQRFLIQIIPKVALE